MSQATSTKEELFELYSEVQKLFDNWKNLEKQKQEITQLERTAQNDYMNAKTRWQKALEKSGPHQVKIEKPEPKPERADPYAEREYEKN